MLSSIVQYCIISKALKLSNSKVIQKKPEFNSNNNGLSNRACGSMVNVVMAGCRSVVVGGGTEE